MATVGLVCSDIALPLSVMGLHWTASKSWQPTLTNQSNDPELAGISAKIAYAMLSFISGSFSVNI
ncbi:MAG: hypothetical protein DRR06_19665 [Gammaproteobacteria bacterium]|nr:MAG: hypothetical protein DRR06_19665 [Gammaproteobacteria bacterium]